jgi:hypothetical protein
VTSLLATEGNAAPSPFLLGDGAVAYLAGIFDGEGHLAVTSGGIGLKVIVLDEVLIDWLVEHFGGRKTVQRAQGNQPRQCFQWWEGRMARVVELLEAMRPWLVIKGQEADAALAYNRYRMDGPKPHPSQPDYVERTAERLRLKDAIVAARRQRYTDYDA